MYGFEEMRYCGRVSSADEEGSGYKTRQYAPDRKVDVLHIKIDVTPDFRRRTIGGSTELTFKPIAKPLSDLLLHAADLTVKSVRSDHAIQGHDVNEEGIVVTFQEPIPPGETAVVTVLHHAEPKEGIYFRTREMGYPVGDEHLWSQGETHESRHWYPSFDYPNERSTSEVICHVPEAMTVLSNGVQLSDVVESGVRTVHWRQDIPHVNYLIALVAGHFEKLEAAHGDLPLGFYVQPSYKAEAPRSFDGIEDIIAFLEEATGVSFPWAQYNQVTCFDHFGGMENTTLTTLYVETLHRSETETLRDSRWIVAHELAHQWFGCFRFPRSCASRETDGYRPRNRNFGSIARFLCAVEEEAGDRKVRP